MIRFLFILSLVSSFFYVNSSFADESNDTYINSISGYLGISEFDSEYDMSFLLSLGVIDFSESLQSSVTLGSINSEALLSTEIYYLYKLNKIYSLFGGVSLFHHDRQLNIGYVYGVDFNYNEKYSIKVMNRSFGAFFAGHDYGLLIGVEFKL
ncbi:TPA: hypothetical protein ACX6PG_002205 [Photobacterium damselae]